MNGTKWVYVHELFNLNTTFEVILFWHDTTKNDMIVSINHTKLLYIWRSNSLQTTTHIISRLNKNINYMQRNIKYYRLSCYTYTRLTWHKHDTTILPYAPFVSDMIKTYTDTLIFCVFLFYQSCLAKNWTGLKIARLPPVFISIIL